MKMLIDVLAGFAAIVTVLSAAACVFLWFYTMKMDKRIYDLQRKPVRVMRWVGLGVIGASAFAVLWIVGSVIV